jgi:hypothetical protein
MLKRLKKTAFPPFIQYLEIARILVSLGGGKGRKEGRLVQIGLP